MPDRAPLWPRCKPFCPTRNSASFCAWRRTWPDRFGSRDWPPWNARRPTASSGRRHRPRASEPRRNAGRGIVGGAIAYPDGDQPPDRADCVLRTTRLPANRPTRAFSSCRATWSAAVRFRPDRVVKAALTHRTWSTGVSDLLATLSLPALTCKRPAGAFLRAVVRNISRLTWLSASQGFPSAGRCPTDQRARPEPVPSSASSGSRPSRSGTPPRPQSRT